ncbi:MAG: hypothetical protein IMF07_05915 [Proteobacteria bacterium]|nr:hypothetical protein [Pseudomonadota bacterium]
MIETIKSILSSADFWAIVISAFVAIFTFAKAKESEREAEWRKEKLKLYLNFMESLSEITESEKTDYGEISFAKACNDLHLLAPLNVINALHKYQKEMSMKNTNSTHESRKMTQENLIYEIRKDLKIKPNEKRDDFNLLMWTSGKKKGENL